MSALIVPEFLLNFDVSSVSKHVWVELVLLLVVLYFLSQRSYKPDQRPLSHQEIDQLCEEWVPDPLTPPLTKFQKEYKAPVLSGAAGVKTTVNGKEVLNLASTNFLGFVGNPQIADAGAAAIRKYGVGSCGPRGFYGTIDIHMDLEEKLARFLGTADSILYSYGLATASSTIPAFCKRGDLIIADEGCHWGIQNGLTLSRSTVKYFKHNDMDDLERLLKGVIEEDRRHKKVLNRRFIVAEGLYQSTGRVAPLRKIVELRDKYFFRLLLDDSMALGVLGATGRGSPEHWGVPVSKVDMICCALGNAFASVGGFCAGSLQAVDHQRLSGLGYCFSASLPPFLAATTISSIDYLESHRDLLSKLQRNIGILRNGLASIPGLFLEGDPISPVMHLQLATPAASDDEEREKLQAIVARALDKASLLLTTTKHSAIERRRFRPSIRIAVSAGHEEKELVNAVAQLKKVTAAVLKK
ncbi:Long-Chain Base 1 [Klebsormidium nitens]|uniref:serine C-palmitoyltransferase n=1 Tax=Klebsormidium nitens TaxID=105231 RepID=A0A1Y1I187_KLENI|nr:Long-Chain Base 1 [Klebsormidium nitens]|eukprot:GAQ82536.1 Long-Chain Base 1 [Klebsormidium nitens]